MCRTHQERQTTRGDGNKIKEARIMLSRRHSGETPIKLVHDDYHIISMFNGIIKLNIVPEAWRHILIGTMILLIGSSQLSCI